ncbi:nuclear factor, interleukin 3 regulated, member 6 [Archocentrus centrarchus]|uniref:nuclear factor, interleukin 3 regulated, member 6 n=1 Tax=Archocentrus centrarchus TaxID=63155 RepID=UPI0011E9FDFF|nr:nuclear factor interleukin-3-regulated protein-like [Archocentrus centrarchus]XP_030591426.1 nuclear factor interleukin-3-regulated protein-like [Archocentrus centrarchus]
MFEEESQEMRGQQDVAVLRAMESPPAEDAAGAGPLSFTDEAVSILTSSSLLARSLLGRTSAVKRKESPSSSIRRKREFIPHEKKDDSYWDKRRKNNEAAKRSREKRRVNDMVLESRVLALLEENARLRAELLALKFRFGLVKDPSNAPILPLTTAPHQTAQPLTPQYYLQRGDGGLQSSSAPHPNNQTGQLSSRSSRDAGNMSEDSGFSTPSGSSVGSPIFFEDRLSDHGKLSPHLGEELGYDLHHSPTDVHHTAGLTGGKMDHPEAMKNLPHKLRFKIPGSSDGIEAAGDSSSTRRSPTFSAAGRDALREKGLSGGEAGAGPCAGSWMQHIEGEEGRRGRQSPQYSASTAGYSLQPPPTQGQPEVQYQHENTYLKCQLNSLSEEVAQLKKLFTEQLMAKTN